MDENISYVMFEELLVIQDEEAAARYDPFWD